MEKVMVHRGNDVVDTASNHIKLKQILRKFNSSADPQQERVHVESVHPDGKIFKGKYQELSPIQRLVTNFFFSIESSVHNTVMHDCNRHRDGRFRNQEFFKIDRVHESYVGEFAKRRRLDQDRKQNMVNNRFPSLADARDQYLKQTFPLPHVNAANNEAQTSPSMDASGSQMPHNDTNFEKTGSSHSKTMTTSVGYVDPNTEPSLLT